MVKRVVVAACLLGLVSTLAACGGEEKQDIGWPCNLLTEKEVREAFGVPVVENTIAGDAVRAEGITAEGVTICQWNGSGETDETMVEIQTVRTLDLFAAYGELEARAEPIVIDRLELEERSSLAGDGQTVVLANEGRSLAIQCRHLSDGGRWEDGTCAELAEQAMGRVEDEELDPKGKVAAADTCDLLTQEEVRDAVGLRTLVSEGPEEDTPLGERGIHSFECRWVEAASAADTDREVLSVWAQLRLADQCDEPIGGGGMFDKGTSYTKVTDNQIRLGAAKGEYCVHLLANKTAIYRYGGDLTEKEATKLLDGAVERLDAA
ncbi:hypothetical protein [Phytohabitans aurantiacus]|uniref:DUF3558 domain-containing protein n=1 Tax=Phytohabitans aurantiacus TaxID=3016789 RepID=A0ABQ5QYW6_9ACTN|nr:hypothetical protein [Phytohabitans aurantiacus]GLH99700.1 hypothetical protein Pa4123_49760 [Phytohabitans aurantiacus]